MFSSQQPWSPRRFSAEMVDEVVRKFLLTLWNTYSFFTLYANIDRFRPDGQESPRRGAAAARPLARRRAQHAGPGRHRRPRGLRRHRHRRGAIQEFVDDLSNWYVRRSRRRFWKSESDADKLAAYHTLYEALVTVAKLLAPFTPFVAEELYQNLVRSVDAEAPESVHLCAWPAADEQVIDAGVSFDMAAARRVVEMGRAARNAAAVKTRQPLAEVVVALPEAEAQAVARLRDVVLDELNAKDLRVVSGEDELVAYIVKPNLKVLGPKLGKRLGPLQTALKEADGAAIVAAVRAAAPPSSLCRTARSVSPRRNSSSRPARPRATRSSPTPAASSRSRPRSTTRCARRAWRASSSTRFSSRAKLPTSVSRTPSA